MKEWKTVGLLTLAGLVYRVLCLWLFSNEIVAGSDQIQYIMLGQRFASGDFCGVLDVYWPPLYPILIGSVTFFVSSPVLPALIISVISGSLAVPATYLLVRQGYEQRVAFIAAAIAIFFPHLINSVFGFGTETIYLLFIISAVILGWRGTQRESAADLFFVGVLVGLAYLTRPEAFGYLAFFGFAVVYKSAFQRGLATRRPARQIACLLVGFALLATPYLIYLRAATGNWTISGKTTTNMMAGKYSERALEENDETDSAPPAGGAGRSMAKAVAFNLIKFHKDLPYLLPYLLLIFVVLGLFGSVWDRARAERECYLILFCLVTVLGYSLAVVEARYFYILLPIVFGWLARGITRFEVWFFESIRSLMSAGSLLRLNKGYFAALCIVLVYFYVLPLNIFMRASDKAWQETAYEERDAGLWLKANGKPAPTVFSATRRPAFYAEGNQLPPTTTDTNEILNQIKDCRVDYVIFGERSLKRNPFLKGFDATLENSPEFELIYQKNDRLSYKILIFQPRRCGENPN